MEGRCRANRHRHLNRVSQPPVSAQSAIIFLLRQQTTRSVFAPRPRSPLIAIPRTLSGISSPFWYLSGHRLPPVEEVGQHANLFDCACLCCQSLFANAFNANIHSAAPRPDAGRSCSARQASRLTCALRPQSVSLLQDPEGAMVGAGHFILARASLAVFPYGPSSPARGSCTTRV